jgi:hypothetical protein
MEIKRTSHETKSEVVKDTAVTRNELRTAEITEDVATTALAPIQRQNEFRALSSHRIQKKGISGSHTETKTSKLASKILTTQKK